MSSSNNGNKSQGSTRNLGDNSDIKQRLSNLDDKLSKVGGQAEPQKPSKRRQAYSYAFRISSELIAGPLVGGFVGYWLDRYFGTTPLFLLILLLLGFAAGIMNVIRTAQEMQKLNLEQNNSEMQSHDDKRKK